jgi:voltage-gated potassium channel
VNRWSPIDLDDQSRALVTRMWSAGLVFLTVTFVGAFGYRAIGGGRWTFSECLYMAVITLSTVGFGETLDGMHEIGLARAWTATLILLGSGTLLYFASTLTAFIVEGDLRGALRRRRMTRLLSSMHDHIIVVGIGATGQHIVDELESSRIPFVVVDVDQGRIERLASELGREITYVIGDATEDHVLEEAGILRARGLIAALRHDKDNLFVTITARALSASIRIVAKAVESENQTKLQRAGADSVVAPAYIGGHRMASEMVRPSVVQFLDNIVRDRENRRIEEVLVSADSPLAGRTLAEANLRGEVDALVIAIRYLDGHHEYNPGPSQMLRAGMVLIVLARTEDLPAIEAYIAGH